ncbi:MAG: bifunctional [glutamate--ammonia ligase]-adenylyl-L-tyrosine phosphorylase/[glutamate--ammonia-ligase] adenylyltransferase [Gammaproteobacteria bacterium]|nr:bifunctional [glutamate--ammonia ligase]-adenylyl-L-tyrosine phosphorylase/[glutamate--ammonia-ligase] adenylyltransferase [Gammaproteobacteria bacterium]MBU1645989.1 bifunctional [glutamate--ammonia ligase]-adenylyl-L-tyrosine phosphorylase/[glutamate--ammonia-ligase] adenylyltransferase [Gammaproteobacteria bacterium]MBU1972051.1 bifunctional [glutamate--ammonia ligase]-adenylyl-L-tyrosine phosphorylase/[glutamate--ammonia-ligase] adenylyltransferase [Gammaproteobacteria bacterium]
MPCSADIAACSRYLGRLFAARPEIAAEVAERIDDAITTEEMRDWLAAAPLTEETLPPALRRLKQRAYARVAARDLSGKASLGEVTETMTRIAEIAVDTARAVLVGPLQERYGTPRNGSGEEQQLIVLGMGKLGGRELNVSSDIDLIFVYPEDGDTDGARSISNFEYFTRLGRQLIAAIAEVTGDGQVFRVDMRLRPNGDSGPLVASFDMLENYFITQGREWERYAWIKARPIGATYSPARLDELEKIRRPFVFRKYLDFGTINAMRDLHAQIRREVARKDMAANVKLGPGGIREIEFIAQVFQLIRGGRDVQLQIKPTVKVLSLLAERGQLDLDAVVELTAAYDFLRRLEHRLQYLDDAQTHSLPESADDQAVVARAMGFANYEALAAELDDHRLNVSRHFEAVFADPHAGDDNHALDNVWHGRAGDGRAEELAARGYHDAATAVDRLDAIRAAPRYQHMSEATRRKFDALVPRVIEAAAATAAPDATLSRLLDLLEAVSRRAAYLALLLQYPQALQQVANIAGSSVWAAEYLKQHPVLMDELLDPRLLESATAWPAFRAQLVAQLDDAEFDTERQMDLMREAHHAQVFRLLAQDIAGLLTVETLADQLSELADMMLDLAIRYAWKKLLKKHCPADAEPRFAIVSYGKLGGKELGYASDLDMIFLFDDPDQDAAATYSKLATRINTWLSSQTSAGQLFETDLRLRPNGDAGLMVVSLDGFRQYQLESAWMWEHQALTRARFSAGDPAIGAGFEKIRCEILCQPRDLAKLREEVLAMRSKMYDAHAGKSELFDVKHDPGGLIDVEFMVQYLVLGHAAAHPELAANKGNIALLKIAADAGLLPSELAERGRDAYREYRRLQHQLRLNNLPTRVDTATVSERIDAVRALWRHVFGE